MKKVIYSPGFGAGWSTWNDEEKRNFLALDPVLAEMAEAGATSDEAEAYIKKSLGLDNDDYICMLGWEGIKTLEIPSGTLFMINEYDGSESIQLQTGDEWLVA